MVKITIAVLLLLGSVARAEERPDSADPDTALRLSILGSAIPVAAIGLGTFVGLESSNSAIRDFGSVIAIGGALAGVVTPSLGELYSHRWLTVGMALRTGGVFAEMMGYATGFSHEIGDCLDPGPCHHSASTYGLLIGGAALYLGGMVLDVVSAPEVARAWTGRHEVQLLPTAMKTTSGTTTGMALSLVF